MTDLEQFAYDRMVARGVSAETAEFYSTVFAEAWAETWAEESERANNERT